VAEADADDKDKDDFAEDGENPEVLAVLRDGLQDVSGAAKDREENGEPKKKKRKKTDMFRLCDDKCQLPQGWPQKLEEALSKIRRSTTDKFLNLDGLVEAFYALERCEACETLRAEGSDIVVSVTGDGCQPLQGCTDFLRWLRQLIAPHYPSIRSLLRRIYEIRQHTGRICEVGL